MWILVDIHRAVKRYKIVSFSYEIWNMPEICREVNSRYHTKIKQQWECAKNTIHWYILNTTIIHCCHYFNIDWLQSSTLLSSGSHYFGYVIPKDDSFYACRLVTSFFRQQFLYTQRPWQTRKQPFCRRLYKSEIVFSQKFNSGFQIPIF